MENPQLDPATAQRTATMIGLSLALGVTMFAAVAWFSQQNATAPGSSDVDFTRKLVYAWVGFTTLSTLASIVFWRTRVEPLISGHEPLPRERMPQLTANLLICWALIEAPALLGVTIYFVTGSIWVAAVSVMLIWISFLTTRPQIEWYEKFR